MIFHSRILRWIAELVRVDMHLEISMMASYAKLPGEGHLEILYKIFAHIKKHHNTEMGFIYQSKC